MAALTKGGKTTIAMALCNPKYRAKMASLSNCRTEVTVDWTYDTGANDIALKENISGRKTELKRHSKRKVVLRV